MRRPRLAAALLASALALTTACQPTEATRAAAAICLGRSEVQVLSGPQGEPYRATTGFPAGGGIDARAATWDLRSDYPFYVQDGAGPDICIVGGRVSDTLSHETTPWATWKVGTGFLGTTPRLQIAGMHLANVGDGFRFARGAEGWSLRGVRVTDAHDDCIEDDDMLSGTVDDSYLGGCFVLFSARDDDIEGTPVMGFDRKVRFTSSLLWSKDMPFDYRGGTNDNGAPWKLGNGPSDGHHGLSPRLGFHDTIIRFDSPPVEGDLALPSVDHDGDPATPVVPYLDEGDCSGNTIVWTGEGAPGAWADSYPPSCFTITTDVSVWDRAVARWEADHA